MDKKNNDSNVAKPKYDISEAKWASKYREIAKNYDERDARINSTGNDVLTGKKLFQLADRTNSKNQKG